MLKEVKKILETQKNLEKEQVNYKSFVKEKSSLKATIEDLTNVVYKFTQGKKSFDLMLGEQKWVFDKERRHKPFF